ncbi:MerR family transcriptional regulator [Flavobacteriaceae bacterium]|nr:MerR family transcriptional regulator [Flavobacteriaceae bacterium]MDA9572062.1 MerR family transcriptional regulator [Flavobacteriaceae bacterium]MDC3354752.1 MerR family transcriptional regulator [Flavobacteriaceae bacterium]
MKRIKSTFSIKNLENLSGIKAHTLRIWEKRYNLLEPERTDTNIRRYSLDSLKRLLNITLLYNHGFKISKIASLNEDEIPELIRSIALKSNSEQVAINAFKLAMINFDYDLFDTNYNEILQHHDFQYVFLNVFMPLMRELGILWQTGAISPAHEHFVTNLIKQKLHLHTESLQRKKPEHGNLPIFVIFLPENEIHELGVLYLNYLILNSGYRTIFLGQSLQTSSLETLYSYNSRFYFVSYLTVEPNKDEIMPFLNNFYTELLENRNSKLLLFGPQQIEIDTDNMPDQIELFRSVESFIAKYLEEVVFV